ncbi:MipA/OmpV family protein [Thalassotalea ganghwensis]
MTVKCKLLIVVFISLFSRHLFAQQAEPPPIGETVVGQWNFSVLAGYAVIENPLKNRDDIDTHLLPTWSYYGDRFYIDNTSLGYSLVEQEQFILDVVGYLNEEGAYFNLDNAQWSFLDVSNFVPHRDKLRPNRKPIVYEEIERDFSYMAGISMVWPNDWLQAKLTYGQDISAGHHGAEVSLDLFNYYQLGNFQFSWQLGAVYKNRTLVEYYYQYRPEELGGFDSPYKFDHVVNSHLQLAVSYRLSTSFDLVLSLKQTWLDEGVMSSKLVEKDRYLKGLVGVNFKF